MTENPRIFRTNKLITLQVEYSERCEYDYVQLKFNNGSQTGKFCGDKDAETFPPLDPMLLVDNSVEVKFHTDFSTDAVVHGFRAHYSAVDVNECLVNNGGCSQFCHNFIGGYHCSCKIGYTLHKDKKQCIGRSLFYRSDIWTRSGWIDFDFIFLIGSRG